MPYGFDMTPHLASIVALFLVDSKPDLMAWTATCKAALCARTDPCLLHAGAQLMAQRSGKNAALHIVDVASKAKDRGPYEGALGLLLGEADFELSAEEATKCMERCLYALWYPGLSRLVAARPASVTIWVLKVAAMNDMMPALPILEPHITGDMAHQALRYVRTKQFALELIAKGADLATAVTEEPPMLSTAIRGHYVQLDLVEMLLEAGANPNVGSRYGRPLEIAIKRMGDHPATLHPRDCLQLSQLLFEHGADPTIGDAIHMLIEADGVHMDILSLMISRYGDVSLPPQGGTRLPLTSAVIAGKMPYVRKLLEAGADPVLSLHATSHARSPECMWVLLNDPRVDAFMRLGLGVNNTLLHDYACGTDTQALIRLVHGRQPLLIDSTDGEEDGLTPLLRAIKEFRPENARLLLSLGADPLALAPARAQTALHLAVEADDPASAAAVLDALALAPGRRSQLLRARDLDGYTALHRLCMRPKVSAGMLDCLLSAGADPDAKAPDGHTALHYALHNDAGAHVMALLGFGADKSMVCPQHGDTSMCSQDLATISIYNT